MIWGWRQKYFAFTNIFFHISITIFDAMNVFYLVSGTSNAFDIKCQIRNLQPKQYFYIQTGK